MGLVSSNNEVWSILCKGGMKEFMEACKVYDQALYLEVLRTWKEGVCSINNLRVEFNATTIVEVIHMQNEGKELKRETKLNKM